ncbi:cell wall-binding repeat-containing protein [Romboutsia ilealis]|uniref:cell wall-binding repeat-containing protein n=1 Tax=Romboutsia ilealis TaxID=1115758 RepID=UPI002572F3A1|nr:cell wall-binding repeat-containing protein [Romboutsia ilealis]
MKKIISISLLIALVLTTPIYANTSKGNYIIINNESTNPYTTQTTGNFQNQKNINNSKQKTSTPYAIDQVLPKPENAKLYQSKTKNNKSSKTTREFKTFNFRNNQYETINTDLKYSGKKVEIWVYENQISDAQAIRIGQEFDNNIYPLMTKKFGEESDVDNNDKINIVIYDIKDYCESTNVFTQGYFNPIDLYDDEDSNKGEVLYIDTYPTMDVTDFYGNQGIENLYPVIVHEFQHMINFNESSIKGNKGSVDTWINEGLSMAAEQVYTNKPRMDRINYYNLSNSITNGHSLLYWDYYGDVLSNYSLSYLFMQYLNIQAGVGEGIYKEIIQSPNNNYKAIENVIKKYIDPNISFGEFMTDFRMALTLNQSTGKYGFKNKEGFNNLQKKIYNGNEINLRGGGAIVVKTNSSLDIPSNKGDNIVYFGSDEIDKELKNHVKIIGENRYDTAAKISKAAFNDKSDTVVLINGKNSSDGLAAGPFASLINASILLIEKDYIPNETVNEIKRLNPKNVYLIGGIDVVSEKVKDDIQNIIDINAKDINRIGGVDREETSLLIGKEIAKLSNVENIYVVNGYKGEADAMSILSKACNEKSPILITNGEKFNNAQKDFIQSIKSSKFYFLGGNNVMSDNLLDEAQSLFDVEISVARLYGDDRQETNGRVLDYFYDTNINSLIVCKSDNLIDTLCVGVFAGKNNIPVLIATNNLSNTQEEIVKYKTYDTLYEVGGGISSTVINKLK